jgi:hypothetical protein
MAFAYPCSPNRCKRPKLEDTVKKIAVIALAASTLLASVPAQALEIVSTTNGTLTTGDLVMSPRVFRDATPSTWAAPKPYPGPFGSSNHLYDLISVAFAPNASQDVYYEIEVGMPLDNDVFGVAYNGSFNSANFGANYLGDHGSSNAC